MNFDVTFGLRKKEHAACGKEQDEDGKIPTQRIKKSEREKKSTTSATKKAIYFYPIMNLRESVYFTFESERGDHIRNEITCQNALETSTETQNEQARNAIKW